MSWQKSLTVSLNHCLMTLICDDHIAWTYGRTKADNERLNCGTLADNIAKHNSMSGSHKIRFFFNRAEGETSNVQQFHSVR